MLIFGLEGGQWGDSARSAIVDPALNKEGKQDGCSKAQDGWPPGPMALPV